MSRCFAILSVLALAACAGAEADPKTSTSPSSTTPPPAAQEMCETYFARARTCTDQYIAALVDLRIELDKPAGITASAQSEGRDAIIGYAMAEWAEDSQPAAITATCGQVLASIPADQLEGLRAEGERCLAMTDCGEFATCAMVTQRARMQAQ